MTTSQEVAASLESVLIDSRSTDGGWSAFGTGPADTESTAWAVIALRGRAGDAAGAAAEGRRWLLETQDSDGAWPVWPSVPQPGWTTALAILALVESGAPATTAAVRGGRWLLGVRGGRISWLGRVSVRLGWITPSVELDHSLSGWPWVPDTFSWVEPTSWAILAMRVLDGSIPEAERRSRTDEAIALLIDRACVSGGWNYGNRTVLGEDLWPYPDTTAIALLALAGASAHRAVGAGVEALEDMLAGPSSRLALALGTLALQAQGREVEALRRRLAEAWLTEEEILAPTTRARALTLLALAGSPWLASDPESEEA